MFTVLLIVLLIAVISPFSAMMLYFLGGSMVLNRRRIFRVFLFLCGLVATCFSATFVLDTGLTTGEGLLQGILFGGVAIFFFYFTFKTSRTA